MSIAPLSLTPPAEVCAVAEDNIKQNLPGPSLTPSAKQDLASRAKERATKLAAIDPMSPEFQKLIADIEAIGNNAIKSTTDISNRLLSSPETALTNKGDKNTPVATTLTELRRTVEDLDPAQASGKKKFLGLIPFGDKIADYFRRFESQQSHIDAIVVRLEDSRDELRKDNAVLKQEMVRLWDMLGQLNQDVFIVQELDRVATEAVETLESTNPEKASKLRNSALFYIRQKHQDLLTHAAVSVQSYLTIDTVISNNTELSKGVHRATTTTVSALKTAVMTAQALNTQKKVVKQVAAVNDMTSDLIESTSELNKTNSVAIQKQATETTINMDSLQKAFANIRETVAEVDQYRASAAKSMSSTICSLRSELERAEGSFKEAGDRQ